MPTSMGVASLKFSKSDRKPKKTKHCTIPKTLTREEEQKEFQKRNWADKYEGGNQRDHKSQDDAQKPSLGELVKLTLVGKKGMKEEGY